MRYHLLKTFDEIYVINLHGNVMKKEKTEDGSNDENIFDIRAGVAISIFIKYADIYHKEILLRNIYINYNVAVSTERGQIAIDFTKEELLEKLNEFASLEEQTARDKYDLKIDSRNWKLPVVQQFLKYIKIDENILRE